MRNIVEFPVTKQEIYECLERIQHDLMEEGRIGDMRPYLVDLALGIILKSDWKQEI